RNHSRRALGTPVDENPPLPPAKYTERSTTTESSASTRIPNVEPGSTALVYRLKRDRGPTVYRCTLTLPSSGKKVTLIAVGLSFGFWTSSQVSYPSRVWPSARYQRCRVSETATVPVPPSAWSKYIARSATMGTSDWMVVEKPAA